MSGRIRCLHDFELEPEVRDWLDSLSDHDFKRVDQVCGMLAEKGTELGGPGLTISRVRSGSCGSGCVMLQSDHVLCTADGRIVLLTVFRKTKQHDQRQIDRAVRAQVLCEREHHGPAAETYERQV